MSAETRWVEYSVAATTSSHLGGNNGVGTRGYCQADNTSSDVFTIGPSNNQLSVNVDATSYYTITLTSGTNLDARFVAKDITEQMHALRPSDDTWKHATALWQDNKFRIFSGSLGAGSQVAVASGTNTAYNTLGFDSNTVVAGAAHSWKGGGNGYNGHISVSGTWEGQFDEIYTVIINKETTIGTPTKGGSNNYNGTFTVGGQYNYSEDTTYTITINAANGATAGGGTGSVPTFSWTNTATSDSGGPVEILYHDHWYDVGTRGLKVKWTDAVFNTCDPAWTVACTHPSYAQGTNTSAAPGTALYIWTSDRGDECSTALTTSDTTDTRLGSRGLYFKFTGGSNNLTAGDEFRVVCIAPQPTSYDVTSLNYGNVTVTTESDVKCVIFEIMSGAVSMTSVKFGLQSHGTFSYHGTGDTYFRFGTVGAAMNAGSSPDDGKEWRTNVAAGDIDSDTPPAYLYATKANLEVVASADDSESIGNYNNALVSDFIFLCIHLGADETGANSSINYRCYFDFS